MINIYFIYNLLNKCLNTISWSGGISETLVLEGGITRIYTNDTFGLLSGDLVDIDGISYLISGLEGDNYFDIFGEVGASGIVWSERINLFVSDISGFRHSQLMKSRELQYPVIFLPIESFYVYRERGCGVAYSWRARFDLLLLLGARASGDESLYSDLQRVDNYFARIYSGLLGMDEVDSHSLSYDSLFYLSENMELSGYKFLQDYSLIRGLISKNMSSGFYLK